MLELLDRPGPMNPMATSEAVITRHIRHFNLFRTPGPTLLAQWHNALQDMAARTRLGIPVLIASDPRHGTGKSSGVGVPATGFSQWPDPVGLAATRDLSALDFVEKMKKEFEAEGLRPKPLLMGRDLIEMGLKPGPRFKEILDRVEDLQLEGTLHTRDEAVAWVRKTWPDLF